MGNSSSSGKSQNDETVDFGYLSPQGVYTGPKDWNQSIVTQLVCSRRLAPFYRPLEDYDDSWDEEQILAARKELPDAHNGNSEHTARSEAPSNASRLSHSKRPSLLKEPSKPEAQVYRGALECPICFLYYPPNINHSRCCGQAICTECFVQIKRTEPTTTHLVSEPAACPYCVQDNFGIVYTPPPWRAGIGADSPSYPWSDSPKGSQNPDSPSSPTHKRRQKSYSADSPEVVTTDHIRPDWEAKLAAVQAAVARRANRRIIMRQVGDRLIPVGITSGRVHALSPEEAAAGDSGETSGSRRSRRRQQAAGNSPFEQFIGIGGQDLEELMVMEAMRLSLLEHEEQQRKEAEAKKKAAAAAPAPSEAGPSTTNVTSSSRHVASSSLSSLLTRPLSSRSRSPSPGPPANPNESSTNWLGRASSPPPFSTLNAALATASTASAVISSSSDVPASSPSITVIDSSDMSAAPTTLPDNKPPQESLLESHTHSVTTSRNHGENLTSEGETETSG